MEAVPEVFQADSDRYYDENIKEFHEMRLGQQTMEEYANKFLELLRYVRYIRGESEGPVVSEWIASVLQR